jgi:hypothetical protein
MDEQYGQWMDIWSELNLSGAQLDGYGTMVGKNYSSAIWQPYDTSVEPGGRLQVPLQFWFCRNVSLSLPIIALEYSEVKINIEFSDIRDCIIAGPTHYVYLTDSICLFKPYELIKVGQSDQYIQFINFE